MTAVRGVIHLTSNSGAGSARAGPDLWEPREAAATRPFEPEWDPALGDQPIAQGSSDPVGGCEGSGQEPRVSG